MKKFLIMVMSLMLIFALTACGTETTNNDLNDDNTSSIESSQSDISTEQDETSEPEITKLSFTLTAGEAGEYGKLVTYNKGTEFEETFYAYYVPAGTYTVTNKGEYMSQINVYSDETVINEDGWEEPKSTGTVKLLDVDKSETITIENGQHIEIAEPSVFELKQQ